MLCSANLISFPPLGPQEDYISVMLGPCDEVPVSAHTDHKTPFKCPVCLYFLSNLRVHIFQMVASQDGRSLNYQPALRMYVRILVDNMWLAQMETLRRMQRNKFHRWERFTASSDDAAPKGCNNEETFHSPFWRGKWRTQIPEPRDRVAWRISWDYRISL